MVTLSFSNVAWNRIATRFKKVGVATKDQNVIKASLSLSLSLSNLLL